MSPLRKFGEGKVLPTDEQQKTAAKTDWTEQDQAELDEELDEDPEG